MIVNSTKSRFSAVFFLFLILSISSSGMAQTCQDYSDYIHVIGALYYDYSGPASPGTENLLVNSGDVVCATMGSYLGVMDVSVPEMPEEAGLVRLFSSGVWEEVFGLAFYGDYVLVNSSSLFTVVQVNNISEPSVVGTLALDQTYGRGDIAVVGDHAVVIRGGDELAVVDLTTPSSPSLAYTTTAPGSVYCLGQSGNYVLMSVSGPA